MGSYGHLKSVVMLVAIAGGVEARGETPSQTPATLPAAGTPDERIEALAKLAARDGAMAEPTVENAQSSDPDPTVRAAATRLLMITESPKQRQRLIDALRGDDAELQTFAFRSTLRMPNAGYRLLLEAAADGGAARRKKILSTRSDPLAVNVAVAVINGDDRRLLLPAVHLLANSYSYNSSRPAPGLSKAADQIALLLADPDADVRALATRTLTRLNPAGLSKVCEALGSKDVETRRAAARVFVGDPSDYGPSLPAPEAREPLAAAAVKDPDAQVREDAVLALAQLGNPAIPSLVAALDDRDPDVRYVAATNIAYMAARADSNNYPDAKAALAKAQAHPNPYVAKLAAEFAKRHSASVRPAPASDQTALGSDEVVSVLRDPQEGAQSKAALAAKLLLHQGGFDPSCRRSLTHSRWSATSGCEVNSSSPSALWALPPPTSPCQRLLGYWMTRMSPSACQRFRGWAASDRQRKITSPGS